LNKGYGEWIRSKDNLEENEDGLSDWEFENNDVLNKKKNSEIL
jgi:hypothetical protein